MTCRTIDAVSLSLITIASALFVTTPYLFPNFLLPRTEELSYSLYPLIVWSKQVMRLNTPQWFNAAGLGVPWPIPHTMSHTPFLPLFAYLPVYTAVAITVMAYMCFQAFYVVKLCRYFAVSRLMTHVALITLLLGVPVEYLQRFDATAVFVGWTLLPAIIYYLLQLLSPSLPRSQLLSATLMLGIIVGYAILNAHIGMFLEYIVALSIMALVFWKRFLPRIPWFFLSALIALAIGAEKILMLTHELPLFAKDLRHLQDISYESFLVSMWSLLCKPLMIPKLDLWQYNLMSRSLTFGCGIFGWISIFACLGWRTMRSWPEAGPMTLAFIINFILSFTPPSLTPGVFSTSWGVRDPALLIGVIIIAKYCDLILRPKLNAIVYHALMLFQLAGVLGSASLFVYSTEPMWAPASYPTGLYNDISGSKADTPLDALLNQAMVCDGQMTGDCAAIGRRYIMSSRAMFAAQSKFQVKNGLIINNSMLHGFENVSYLAKGISMDSIQHSQSIPYGLISGEGFISYAYRPGFPEWTMEDRALLDILGIRAVVGPEIEMPSTSFLRHLGDLPPQDKKPSHLAVYANPGAFPRAFFVDPGLFERARVKPHCGNSTYLVCQDLSAVVPAIDPWQDPIQFEDDNDRVLLHVLPKPYARTALISIMWRPEWSGKANGQSISVASQWGLIKIIIPENQAEVVLTYHSALQSLGRITTLLTLFLSIVGVIFLVLCPTRLLRRCIG